MSVLPLIVLLSLVTYRVTRFALEDSLISQPRNWVKAKLLKSESRDAKYLDIVYRDLRANPHDDVAEWRMKLYELFDCHFCISIWVSAGAVALTDWRVSVPLPVWVWLASSAGAVVVWRWVED